MGRDGGTIEQDSTEDARAGRPLPTAAAPGRAIGDRLGRYTLEAELGAGGMGVVYAARDTVLGRRVALKLVRPGGADPAAASVRLVREAQALARLDHPNVVTVFDVGTDAGDVFMAMELVDGDSLGAWARTTRPSPARVLEVMAAAGRGLAAAHAAGIVHRDFKPDNVLVGRDGRIRVTDFGVARALVEPAAAGAEPVAADLVDADLTRTGALVGTPAYMAPEQLDGAAVTAAADQFGFCVALFELVHGVRPFAGATVGALRNAIRTQTLAAASASAALPARAAAAIRRGLREAPGERHPSMAALLDELAPPARRRWVPRAALGVLAAGALTAAALSVAGGGATDDPGTVETCTNVRTATFATAWSDAERATALARIRGLGEYGAIVAPELEARLRAYLAAWTPVLRDACLATVSAIRSDVIATRRERCIARGYTALGEARTIGTRGEPVAVATLIAGLPPPAACSDVAALLTDVAPAPDHPDEVAAIRDRLERARVHIAIGDAPAAIALAEPAIADARRLAYPPLLAEALLVAGHAAMGRDAPAARRALAEATRVAIGAGTFATAIEAWAREAYVRGSTDGIEVIEALAEAHPEAQFARALLENNRGAIAINRGDERRTAAAALERAVALSAGLGGREALELVNARRNLALLTDDPDARDRQFRDVVDDLARRYGADHPQTLDVQRQRAGMQVSTPAAAETLAGTCARYRLHPGLAAAGACWRELALLRAELGDRGGARDAIEAASVAAPSDPLVGGHRALWTGDPRAAATQFTAALDRLPAGGAWHAQLDRGRLELGRGRALRAAGDLATARAALAASVALLEPVARARPYPSIQRQLARARAELALVLTAIDPRDPGIGMLAGAADAWFARSTTPRGDVAALLR